MSARAASSPDPSHALALRRRYDGDRGRARDSAVVLLIAAAIAGVLVGYVLVHGNERVAVLLSAIPLGIWLLIRPSVPLVLLGASIPALMSLTGSGTAGSGYNVSVSDLLLLVVGGGIALERVFTTQPSIREALRPVAPVVSLYSAVMIVLLGAHHGFHDVAKTGQRFELFLLPLAVGAFAALIGRHVQVLEAYVVATTFLALVFPLDDLGFQHNPVGQLIANAVLVVIGVPALRRFFPCLVVLVPGLLLAGSRGAVLAALLGIAVIVLMKGLQARFLVVRLVPVVVLAFGAFALVAPTLQQRLTSFSASTNSRAGYAVYLRQQYTKDAWGLIHAHPWTGVGVGNYLAGVQTPAQTSDPHEVVLLQAAEGGYPLAAAFVLLIAGSMLALYRMRRIEVAAAAAAVLLATVAHGLVDVFWVRGNPVLGFLLVGMACGGLARSRQAPTSE